MQLLISGGSGHLEYLSVVCPVQAAVSGLPALLNLTEVGQSSGTQSRSAPPTNFYIQHRKVTVVNPSAVLPKICLFSLRFQQNQNLESDALNVGTLTSYFW